MRDDADLLHLTEGTTSLRVKAHGGFVLEMLAPANHAPSDPWVWRVDSGRHMGCIQGRSASGKGWTQPMHAQEVLRRGEEDILGVGKCTTATVRCVADGSPWCAQCSPLCRATLIASIHCDGERLSSTATLELQPSNSTDAKPYSQSAGLLSAKGACQSSPITLRAS